MRSAIILVGGEARRANGQEKYFFQYQGKTFIERLTDSLREITDEIILVAKSPQQCRRFDALRGVRCISDIRPGLGPIGGLHAGVLAAKGDLLFVSACDMPCIERAVVSYLVDAIGDADAAIPSWNEDMLEPLHAVYRRSTCLPAIESAIEAGLWKVISWFPEVKVRLLNADELKAADPAGLAFWNVNTPAEFAEAERLALAND